MSGLRRTPIIVAAALAAAGAVALVSSTTFDDAPDVKSPAAVVPVNESARDQGDISANNSPTLAQNPERRANLVVVNRVDTPAYTCGFHVSHDGGSQWSSRSIPIPRGEQPKCFAPDAAFAADGTLYISYVTLAGRTNAPNALWLTRSTDGGRTLSAPRRVSGPLSFQVRITTDPRRPERLYLTWLQPEDIGLALFTGSDNQIVVARSDDGGRSFRPRVRASDQSRRRVLAPSPAVGLDGELYVLYLDVQDDRLDYEGGHGSRGGAPYQGHFSLVLGRSTDAGATWQESLVDDTIVPTRRFIAFLPPTPSLAVDPRSGRIFVAFEDGREPPSDVRLWSLEPGAEEWDGPSRVNDTPSKDGSTQYLPKLAVAPDGRLDIAYYDRRDDPRDRLNDVSLQSSADNGETFTSRVRLTDESFDSRVGTGSDVGLPDIGSRLGMVSQSSAASVVWTDTRAGTEASNKQDIAFAQAPVESSEPSSARDTLRWGGIALLLVAAGLLAVQARRRPASAPAGPTA
ncbi:MAG TPA: sialidase family protein [Solirubrobacteraceae bacterium]|nr:sialidase family protein [Solirubrobacteraceae bacterium]